MNDASLYIETNTNSPDDQNVTSAEIQALVEIQASNGNSGRENQQNMSKQEEEGSGDGDNQEKRSRVREGFSGMFTCQHLDCNRIYTNAEHLYQHQLNSHNLRKQIHHCDFPDCNRSFIRPDLFMRHKERHATNDVQPILKDTFLHDANPDVTAALQMQKGMVDKDASSPYDSTPRMPLVGWSGSDTSLEELMRVALEVDDTKPLWSETPSVSD